MWCGGRFSRIRNREVVKMGINMLTASLFVVLTGAGVALSVAQGNPLFGVAGVALGLLILASVRVARQWQKAVVLRLGKFRQMEGPGIFGIIPIIDSIPYWIDLRTITTPFTAEQTLTKDGIPVDVDAVL